MNIVAIDPGAVMGWAALKEGDWDYGVNKYSLSPPPKNAPEIGRPVRSGARSMKRVKELMFALKFYHADLLLVEHNLMKDSSQQNAEARGEWNAVIGMAIERYNEDRAAAPIVAVDITSQWWRSRAFTKFPRAPKEITDDNARRDWLKKHSIQRCHALGFTDVTDDNVAEAILMIVAYRAATEPAYSASIGKPAQEKLL